jgi:hypothetical protein
MQKTEDTAPKKKLNSFQASLSTMVNTQMNEADMI